LEYLLHRLASTQGCRISRSGALELRVIQILRLLLTASVECWA
jgi:hypothetical protein